MTIPKKRSSDNVTVRILWAHNCFLPLFWTWRPLGVLMFVLLLTASSGLDIILGLMSAARTCCWCHPLCEYSRLWCLCSQWQALFNPVSYLMSLWNILKIKTCWYGGVQLNKFIWSNPDVLTIKVFDLPKWEGQQKCVGDCWRVWDVWRRVINLDTYV